ncbi:MAG TPA: hypothetical protein VKY59_05355 [Spirillospora sp.]|nr:hypothetical protein [Spirillospora sp.]
MQFQPDNPSLLVDHDLTHHMPQNGALGRHILLHIPRLDFSDHL